MSRKRLSSKLLFALSQAAIALVMTGCGLEGRYSLQVPEHDSINGRYAVLDPTPDETFNPRYRCPSEPNVLPDWDWHMDGSGRYRVCPSRDKASDILIHGTTHEGSEICVFPAQYIDDSHIYTKPSLDGTGPMNSCIPGGATGAYAQFNVNYNAVFIVEKRHHEQMVRCLIEKNYNFCPPFSFGTFK